MIWVWASGGVNLMRRADAPATVEECNATISGSRALTSGVTARGAALFLQESGYTVEPAPETNTADEIKVVGARGERSIKDAVIGTTAERLMERLSRDILVVRAAPKAAYDTVLICVALGPVSCFVVRSAISLSTQARLHMLHAFEPLFETKLVSHGAASETIRSHRLAAKREAAQALHTFLEQCVLPSDRHVATMLRRGNPPHEILIAAAHLRAGVIAVGKNQSAVEEFFLGSATKHIIRVASSDVLISAAH